MSRNPKRKPFQMAINQEVARILEDPNTMHYLARKLIRRKPKLMPMLLWKGLLLIVLAPEAKKKHPMQ